MKYAVAALLGCTSAIKVNTQLRKEHQQCVDHIQSDDAFNKFDTDHSGSLSYDEVKVGVEYVAAQANHTLSAEEWAWVKETGANIDTVNPGHVDREEFYRFINAAARHWHLCKLAKKDREEDSRTECVDHKQAIDSFNKFDTDHSGLLDYAEMKAGIQEEAASFNHTISAEEWDWVKEEAGRIDINDTGNVDHEEFYRFSNAAARHWKLCKLDREDRREERRPKPPCVSHKQAEAAFNAFDTDRSKLLDQHEMKAGILQVAANFNHTLSADEVAWLKETGARIDTKDPGNVDPEEFYRFVNAAAHHWKLCPLAREEERREERNENYNQTAPANQTAPSNQTSPGNHTM